MLTIRMIVNNCGKSHICNPLDLCRICISKNSGLLQNLFRRNDHRIIYQFQENLTTPSMFCDLYIDYTIKAKKLYR